MNIAIDAREWREGGAGKSRYVNEVINHLIELDNKNNYYLLVNQEQKKKLPMNFEAVTLPKWPYFWLGKWQKLTQIDLFFSPTSYLMSIFSRVKTITVVHDLAVFLEKRARPSFRTKVIERLSLKLALKHSSKVITVSENTSNDIRDNYKIDPKKMVTIYLAAATVDSVSRVDIFKKYSITKPYILYVGTIEPRKNVEAIIRAFSLLSDDIKNNYQLVLAGKRGWNIEYIDNLIKSSNLEVSIIETGFIPDSELPLIYKGSSLFVYPSWYEGFGLPVLEAMKFGVPVITSNTSSLPGVTGKAAKLVQPDDIPGLAKAMSNILGDKTLREKMSRMGVVRSGEFSWEKSVTKLLKEFEVLGGKI